MGIPTDKPVKYGHDWWSETPRRDLKEGESAFGAILVVCTSASELKNEFDTAIKRATPGPMTEFMMTKDGAGYWGNDYGPRASWRCGNVWLKLDWYMGVRPGFPNYSEVWFPRAFDELRAMAPKIHNLFA
ncbi:MAG: hypothetical protein ABFD96_15810, partial [Armatimonadia bacterium]